MTVPSHPTDAPTPDFSRCVDCVGHELPRDECFYDDVERARVTDEDRAAGWRIVNEEPEGMLVPGRHLAERIAKERAAARAQGEAKGRAEMREMAARIADEHGKLRVIEAPLATVIAAAIRSLPTPTGQGEDTGT